MKYILLILCLNLFTIKGDDKINNNINVKVVDMENNEELVAVKNYNSYSDFNGNVKINKGDSISLELISYENITIKSVKNDTTIKMKRIK